MSDEQSVIITDLLKACGRKNSSLESTLRNTKSTKTMKRLVLFKDFFGVYILKWYYDQISTP